MPYNRININMPEFSHSADINAKCHLMDKLLNYNLTLGRHILHKLGIIFNFENISITCQEVLISKKPPNYTAKEFFVIKESCSNQNVPRWIKQILDAEHKKIS